MLTLSPSYGGREASLALQAKNEAKGIGREGEAVAVEAKGKAQDVMADARQKVEEVKDKVVK